MIDQLMQRRKQTKKNAGLNSPSFSALKEIQEVIYRMRREHRICNEAMKPFLFRAIQKKQKLIASVKMKPHEFIRYVALRDRYGNVK